MILPRFLSPEPLTSKKILTLPPKTAHHMVRVLRMKEGDLVNLIDGLGHLAKARVVLAGAKQCQVQIETIEDHEKRSQLHVAFGITKSSSLDFLVRRVTEIGVASLHPLVTQHSQPSRAWNQERWKNLIEEVCKQCEELVFPKIEIPLELPEFFNTYSHFDFWVTDDSKRTSPWPKASNRPVCVVIGPEGGWSDVERRLFSAVPSIGLGLNRLRAETAALVAVVLAKERLGEIV